MNIGMGIGVGFQKGAGSFVASPAVSFLQMNGVGDNLLAPSMTYTKIVIDMQLEYENSAIRYIVQNATTSVRVQQNGTLFSSYTSNGFHLTNRCLLDLVAAAPVTSSVRFFSRTDGVSNHLKGKIFDIKIYNGSILIAHYDMSVGNVLDQSGNGNHATIVGGNWI